ncbi:S-adenosyl-L-methionine-dependent methyltransferase [Choiromyces venosus 120613-1]|uniref:S-adenosyl-L-methionine-dependent methyltransferase n=1 Tax=Choiromyces venosus 120613-1 TaxID=1336337 RepID=A0A3N4JXG9_9PEZI|nr:S-adenosyl-L-methionine-dependent methyltransferase [Choiromyces venosus 120613-1]
MAQSTATTKDHWSSKAYSEEVAPFVAELTTKVVALLDPQPTDKILDLGCGDGILTARLSHHCQSIHGIDNSTNMITSAKTHHSTPNTTYTILNATHLPTTPPFPPQTFTKIFSNAALHWILRAPPSSRLEILQSLHNLLIPTGTFAAEFGAHGNCAEVHAAIVAALVHRGVPVETVREACPWWFPSEEEVESLWTQAGFLVESVEVELRQTELPQGDVGGWVKLFGNAFLELLGEESREEVVQEVVSVLESIGRYSPNWENLYARLCESREFESHPGLVWYHIRYNT